MIQVKLKRGRIGLTPHQRKVLDSLGLRRREAVKSFEDNAAIRGMIEKVKHLLEVTES
ncbi:MAG: 50S ribosomal protein L30 [Mailhella sp.]|nr:50S ribosomal protein L30 [Mailhella sp.]